MSESENEQAWNAKVKIAEQVVPILLSYKQMVLSGNSFSIPNWVIDDGETLNEGEMIDRWLEYLDAMINSFNFELEKEVLDDQKLDEQEKGLYLFAKYYKHLWD